jgi:hypothetical protein
MAHDIAQAEETVARLRVQYRALAAHHGINPDVILST